MARAWRVAIAVAGTAAGWSMVLREHGLWLVLGALAVMAGPATLAILFADWAMERRLRRVNATVSRAVKEAHVDG